MTELQVTRETTVTEDQIDHLGHMNVMYYGANARAATGTMVDRLGFPDDLGWRLDDVYTRHHREQMLGTELVVRSGVIDAEAGGLRLYHELASTEGVLAATFVHRLVAAGEAGPVALPPDVVAAADAQRIVVPEHGATRSISLDVDRLGSAPSLDEVRTRELAIRLERKVLDVECDEAGDYLPDRAPMLVWGGEANDDRATGAMLIPGPNGEQMGWATMETRMMVNRWPRVGDRIQSFGALVALHDKVNHRIMWAYDLETEEVLVAFEAISLAFDTVSRRPMSIPEKIRRRELRSLHPDLAVPSPA